eukprot:COSAG06_NODE_4223_length_4454_cov_5.117566_4_plen_727_part_00
MGCAQSTSVRQGAVKTREQEEVKSDEPAPAPALAPAPSAKPPARIVEPSHLGPGPVAETSEHRSAEPAESAAAADDVGDDQTVEEYTRDGISVGGLLRVITMLMAQRDGTVTTSDFCQRFIKPRTVPAGWVDEPQLILEDDDGNDVSANRWYTHSYVQSATDERQSAPPSGTRSMCALLKADPASAHLVGKPTHFLSHAWTYKFIELVSAIQGFVSELPEGSEESTFFWFDCFSLDQHAQSSQGSEWWSTTFMQAIGSMGHTVMVLSPFDNPRPLTRSWCLWELFCTLETGAAFDVCLSPTERASFEAALLEDVDALLKALSQIDVSCAEAGNPHDQQMIMSAVNARPGGSVSLNEVAIGEMRKWLINTMVDALSKLGLRFESQPTEYRVCCAAAEEDMHPEMEALFTEPCGCMNGQDEDEEDRRLSFGNWYQRDRGTKEVANICVEHYRELLPAERSNWKSVESVGDLGPHAHLWADRKVSLEGSVVDGATKAHAASLLMASTNLLCEMNVIDDNGMSSLATLLWNTEDAARQALEFRKELHGLRDVRTAEATFLLACCSDDEDVGFDLHLRAFEIRTNTLPMHSPEVAESMKFVGRRLHETRGNLSSGNENADDAKVALPFYTKALATYTALDPQSADTIGAMNDVACALESMQQFEAARKYATKALEMSEQANTIGFERRGLLLVPTAPSHGRHFGAYHTGQAVLLYAVLGASMSLLDVALCS